MKQMNALERQLKLKLLTRTSTGVRTTEEGAIIYQGAKFMLDYAQKTITSARAVRAARETTFCVGTSLLNPAKVFMDLWYQVNRDFHDYKLHLVPFEDDHNGILSEIETAWKEIRFSGGCVRFKVLAQPMWLFAAGSISKDDRRVAGTSLGT
jgi:DNA-binding transcriptional LysR family regulator